MKTNLLKFSTVLMLVLSILGCDSQSNSISYAKPKAAFMRLAQPSTVWDRMASDFSFKTHHKNPRVDLFVKQYTKENSSNLIKYSGQATPYLYHVVQMLEERGLPPELALLPMIESEYRPLVVSNRGAAGIWQLAPVLGRIYGLKQDQWYDGRKDPEAATKVALAHLEYLYKKFDHDWLLVLAAYNCGDARLSNAIRANKKAGLPTDYWSLKLPQETMYFVPKFLALVHLVKNHRAMDINLAAIPNTQHFNTVTINKQINLQQAAKLANIELKEVQQLNPGFKSQMTHPNGPHQIALPVKNISTFKANYKAVTANSNKTAKTPATPKVAAKTTVTKKAPVNNKLKVHTVNSGDTLNKIATKHRTTVAAIKNKNKLNSDIIKLGQKLAI